MSRILLAWELGDNYGHISALLCIARRLRQRGHQVLFAVKNVVTAGQLLDAGKFPYVQAPCSGIRQNRSFKPVSFADIQARAGFGNAEVLGNLVRSWQEIFRNVRPDVVVGQYAPVVQFASRLSGLPCLQLNTGFEYPPDEAPYPLFRPHCRLTREQLLTREEDILKNVNNVSLREGHVSFARLQEVLKADIDLLSTFPELDHYRQRRNGKYIGTITLLDHGIETYWREEKSSRIFVYLRTCPGIGTVLEDLAASGADVIAHIPGINERLSAKYAGTSLRLTASMVRLSGLMADMDVAITHGGHGITGATMLAGVPMLMVPTTVEQGMMSSNIEHQGIGIGMKRAGSADEFRTSLTKLLTDKSYRERAGSVAKKYTGHDQERVLARIVNTIERLPVWLDNRRKLV